MNEARRLSRKAETIVESLPLIPSFKGKAQFMDKVMRLRDDVRQLAAELAVDLSEKNQA